MSIEQQGSWERSIHIMWGVVIAILVIGLLNLYSALHVWGEDGGIHLFWSQLMWVVIGLAMAYGLYKSDYRLMDRVAYPLYFLSLILLVAVLVAGKEVGGNKNWLGVGGFGIQPSEFAKLATMMAIAKYFGDRPNPAGYTLWGLRTPILMTMAPIGMVILGKDMGNAMFFGLILFSLAIFARVRFRTLLVSFLIISLMGAVVYRYGLSDYQQKRIETFLNPEQDIRGSGYQVMQSRIAVGSGEWFGKGFLRGSINKLRYLPEKHTDFVFPVLAEEWGFVGCTVTLGFYLAFILMGLRVAHRARDRFGMFVTVGAVAIVFWQVIINLGGVLGLMPMTGVTLPLLSYGGSSMLATMAAIGIVLSVSAKRFVF